MQISAGWYTGSYRLAVFIFVMNFLYTTAQVFLYECVWSL